MTLFVALLIVPLAGNAAFDASYDVRLVGEDFDFLGQNVVAVGDVNGDGYPDLAAGAGYHPGGDSVGAVDLYFGSASGVSTLPDLTLDGEQDGDYFGYGNPGIAGADLNGDGYDDIIVSAYSASPAKVYVYLGGAVMNAVADLSITVTGYAVSSAGDVNDDGYEDFAVGTGGGGAGNAYIYFGGAALDGTADITFAGQASGDAFGSSLAFGDTNGDGNIDFITTAPGNGAGDPGAVYVFLGSATTIDTTFDLKITGAAGETLGYAVAAGDVNGDGFDDTLAGSVYSDTSGSDAGAAYLYFGAASLDTSADLTFLGQAAGDYFGSSVLIADDLNGDGARDIVITAPYNDPASGTDAGKVYVHFGGAGLDTTADVILTGETPSDYFGGYSYQGGIASADFNQDDANDLAVGAACYDTTADCSVYNGAVYVFLGDPPPTLTGRVPADNATDIATDTDLVLTFSEAVQGGTGAVVIRLASDGSLVESVAASGAFVTGSGTTTITVNPAATLAPSTAYYIEIEPNAFLDGNGHSYAGISDTTTWNFTTAAASSASGGGAAARAARERLRKQQSDSERHTHTQSPSLAEVGIAAELITSDNPSVPATPPLRQADGPAEPHTAAPAQEAPPAAQRSPLEQRVCVRVHRWFSALPRVLERVNVRLLKRFGFVCAS